MNEFSVEIAASSGPRVVREWAIRVVNGTTVLQALAQADGLAAWVVASGLASDITACDAGIWGRSVRLDHIVEPHDRIEIYRALTVDPKVARRERFKKQGRRSAGLFVKKTSPLPLN